MSGNKTSCQKSEHLRGPLMFVVAASGGQKYTFFYLQSLTMAILFLSSLSLCLLCSSNRSTAYCSLSFFCRNLFNSSILVSLRPPAGFIEVLLKPCDEPPRLEFLSPWLSLPSRSSYLAL